MSEGYSYYWGWQKSWWRNMDNVVINYKHCGEDFNMKFGHMFHKCRLDRIGGYYRCWRGCYR